jgi:hypothetical protein
MYFQEQTLPRQANSTPMRVPAPSQSESCPDSDNDDEPEGPPLTHSPGKKVLVTGPAHMSVAKPKLTVPVTPAFMKYAWPEHFLGGGYARGTGEGAILYTPFGELATHLPLSSYVSKCQPRQQSSCTQASHPRRGRAYCQPTREGCGPCCQDCRAPRHGHAQAVCHRPSHPFLNGFEVVLALESHTSGHGSH